MKKIGVILSIVAIIVFSSCADSQSHLRQTSEVLEYNSRSLLRAMVGTDDIASLESLEIIDEEGVPLCINDKNDFKFLSKYMYSRLAEKPL